MSYYMAARRQEVPHPQAERERFGKTSRAHRGKFDEVGPGADLPDVRKAKGVGLPVEIEAWHLHQPQALGLV